MKKPVYSIDYFMKYKDFLSEKYKKVCNYEYDLSLLLPDFNSFQEDIRETVKYTVTRLAAKQVAECASERLKKEMHKIKDIREGRAALGFISQTQEVREWHDMNEGFEFACFMLAQFKTKYDLK